MWATRLEFLEYIQNKCFYVRLNFSFPNSKRVGMTATVAQIETLFEFDLNVFTDDADSHEGIEKI